MLDVVQANVSFLDRAALIANCPQLWKATAVAAEWQHLVDNCGSLLAN